MFLLLRALPGTWGVDLEVGKCDLGCTALHGVEPWKVSWQRVQKSKRQLRRMHIALWASAECFAGEPQRLQGRRDSCCFRLLAAWMEKQKHWFKGVMWFDNQQWEFHVLKWHAGENTNLLLHSRWSAYTVRSAWRSSGMLLFACWPWDWEWMRKMGCWRRPGSECKITPSWIQPHLWSASSHFASRSFLTPEKNRKQNTSTNKT